MEQNEAEYFKFRIRKNEQKRENMKNFTIYHANAYLFVLESKNMMLCDCIK